MPATDGTQAGHSGGMKFPDPPASAHDEYGAEAVKMLHTIGDEHKLLAMIRVMHNAARVGAWMDVLQAIDHPHDHDRLWENLLERSKQIQAGEVSQPDEWARVREQVRADHPEWEESIEGDPRERQDMTRVAGAGRAD